MRRNWDWRREGIGVSPSGPSSTPDETMLQPESGPSRIPMDTIGHQPQQPIDVLSSTTSHHTIDSVNRPACDELVPLSRSIRRRQRRRTSAPASSSSLISLLPPFLLPFLPTASAAPPPSHSRPTTPASFTITPAPRRQYREREVAYITSASTPPTPIASIIDVDETVIPYLLSQRSDGRWEKAEGGWLLYGRRGVATEGVMADGDGTGSATSTSTTSAVTATSTQTSSSVAIATFAVESALPNGWGSTSSRTSIYKVPLIVVASCIIAVAIVVLLAFIVITRRRRHRRQKRAKERLRRKALAAAGLSEADINDSAAKAAFKEKLVELEAQRRAKSSKGGKGGQGGQTALAKSKVRGWNRRLGLRRRKTSKKAEEGGPEVDEDDDEVKSIKPASAPISSRSSAILPESEDRQSIRSRRSSNHDPTSGSEDLRPDVSSPPDATIQALAAPIATTSAAYFPPAYRPASVRSLNIRQPTSSSSSGNRLGTLLDSHDAATVLSGPEKIQAPGYYSAPATEDGEVALAIASRSDGKARMVDPPDAAPVEEEGGAQRMGHIATDDKRVLERLRLGASAPPGSGLAQQEATDVELGSGPSAPTVEVDEHGFETIAEFENGIPPPNTSSSPASVSSTNSAFPPPPTLRARHPDIPSEMPRSQVTETLDVRHLLPSAPPIINDDHVPSAPAFLEDDDEGDQEVASAPPLALDAEETVGPSIPEVVPSSPGPSSTQLIENRDGLLDVQDGQEGESNSVSVPTVFLPRYEP